jgi:hypothetical protein
MEGLVRSMPEEISISGPEWIALFGTSGMRGISTAFLRWRRQRRVAFRQPLLHGLYRLRSHRRSLEGRLLRTLANASLEVIAPWQAILQSWLPSLLRDARTDQSLTGELAHLRTRLASHERHAARAIHEVQGWSFGAGTRIVAYRPLGRRTPANEKALQKLSERYFAHREFWVRQSRAVDAEIDLDCRLASTCLHLTTNADDMLVSTRKEHEELLGELGTVVKWLENWSHNQDSSFPPALVEIVSAPSRLAAWEDAAVTALEGVPESVEVTSHITARPSWRRAWKTEAPRRVFQNALDQQNSGQIREGLVDLEYQHKGIIREIERARNVVAFACESAKALGPDAKIEREGIDNARSLLAFHREQNLAIPAGVESAFASGLAAASLRTLTALDIGQFGVVRQSIRYGLPSTLRNLLRISTQELSSAAKSVGRASSQAYREALIRIGWSPAPTARIEHVTTRGFLLETLGTELHQDRLPAIYQRLFRLDPVDDLRFLIGRQEEMTALSEARRLWEQGRDSGVIIVGERGSGKTSLINCALHGPLAGLETVRGEFSQRLTRAEQLDEFLSHLLDTRPQDLERHLLSKKRVIILEEMERTFLRRVGHYDALRSFLNLIVKTSRTTLWILSTNYFSFRLLNASLSLDPHFSHRINAMAVDREYLREAILMRHNLSGLRLVLAPRPEDGTYSGLRRFAGVQSDLESEYFDVICRESGGVFRSAFALWQRYVERVEDGVLYMRYPSTPRSSAVLRSLSETDFFTLAAIKQHGSLTPAEHSSVFRLDEASSAGLLENLLARELVQPDPGRPGYRVVPEAGEIVRRALFQRNLG